MRKRTNPKGLAPEPTHNPVAKYAHQFNKAQFLADKRQYQRKAKHPALEPFSISLLKLIEKGFNAVAA